MACTAKGRIRLAPDSHLETEDTETLSALASASWLSPTASRFFRSSAPVTSSSVSKTSWQSARTMSMERTESMEKVGVRAFL